MPSWHGRWRIEGCEFRVNPYSCWNFHQGADPVPSSMFPLLAPLTRLLQPQAAFAARDPLQQLMERAGARAGHDPQQARELREAAAAWLRVIR